MINKVTRRQELGTGSPENFVNYGPAANLDDDHGLPHPRQKTETGSVEAQSSWRWLEPWFQETAGNPFEVVEDQEGWEYASTLDAPDPWSPNAIPFRHMVHRRRRWHRHRERRDLLSMVVDLILNGCCSLNSAREVIALARKRQESEASKSRILDVDFILESYRPLHAVGNLVEGSGTQPPLSVEDSMDFETLRVLSLR